MIPIARQIGVLFIAACALSSYRGYPQSAGPAAPTALIVTYKAKPGERLRFLSLMRTEGVAQYEKWKVDGVFTDYQLLQPAFAAAGMNTPDLYAILRFSHFIDLAGWQRIEKSLPGGLPQDAQNIAWADTSGTADLVKEESAAPTTKDSQFFVLTYSVSVPIPAYRKYALGYAVPQFEQWMKAGVLNSFVVFTNQNPAGAPWHSLILLEYKNIEALGRREIIKDQARDALAATNPEWKKWSEDKTNVRNEQTAVPVLLLPR